MEPLRDTQNPYQAPVTGVSATEVPATLVSPPQFGAGLYRDGNILVAAKGAVFPDRCVKCNAPAEGYRLTQALYWHHPAIYLTILAGLLIFIVLAIVLRKSATFQVGVCPRHRRARDVATLLAWLTFLSGMIVLFASLVVESWPMASGGMVAMPLGIIVGIVKSRVIWPKRIDDTHARIKGAGEEFLASIAHDGGAG